MIGVRHDGYHVAYEVLVRHEIQNSNSEACTSFGERAQKSILPTKLSQKSVKLCHWNPNISNILPVPFLSTQGIWVTQCINRLNAPLNSWHITLLNHPLPENSISLRDIPKMSPVPPKEMSQADQTLMQEWVQQVMVRPCGNEQLDSALRNIMLEIFPWMCMKRSYLLGERVTFENANQDSEYDSGSSEEERE